MTPGPIAINSATFVGQDCRNPGSSGFHVRCIPPSCILVTLLAWLYLKYQKMDLLAECLTVSATGGCGDDRVWWAYRFWHSFRNGADVIALADTRCDGGIFCDLPDPSRKTNGTRYL